MFFFCTKLTHQLNLIWAFTTAMRQLYHAVICRVENPQVAMWWAQDWEMIDLVRPNEGDRCVELDN